MIQNRKCVPFTNDSLNKHVKNGDGRVNGSVNFVLAG